MLREAKMSGIAGLGVGAAVILALVALWMLFRGRAGSAEPEDGGGIPEADIFVSKVMTSPHRVELGQAVTLTVVVANTNLSEEKSMTVTTSVDGKPIDTRTVTRRPGEWTGYFLEYIAANRKEYIVKAGGKSATFTVV